MNKPRPIIFLFGNKLVCLLLMLFACMALYAWLENALGWVLPVLLLVLAFRSCQACQQIVNYENYKRAWDAAGNEDAVTKNEKPRNPKRGQQIAAFVFLWGRFSSLLLFGPPREADPEFHSGLLLGVSGITLLLGYFLLHAILSKLTKSFFKRRDKQPTDYIVSHCQPVPRAAATATQIMGQLPSYCQTLLQHKP